MIVQRITKAGIKYDVTMSPNTKIAKYFTLSELANNQGDSSKAQYIDSPMSEVLRCILDDYRSWRCLATTVSCSYRQPEWNKKVGGIESSLHVLAQAADVQFPNMTDAQWNNVKAFMVKEFNKYSVIGELIRYTWGFHVGVGVTYQSTHYISVNE